LECWTYCTECHKEKPYDSNTEIEVASNGKTEVWALGDMKTDDEGYINWICPECRKKRGQKNIGELREFLIKRQEYWKCEYCDTANEIDRQKCLNCGAPRRVEEV
jgi:ssDNA-binding Zn-finger/Zn-ribbon topoisomerase 1